MKRSNFIYILLVSFGFFFIMVGMISLMAIAYIDNVVLFYLAFASMGFGALFYVIAIIIYIVRRRRNNK